jgi:hypothetical protein
MSGARLRGRAAVALAGLVCAAGLAACDGGGDGGDGAAAPSASAPAATSASDAPAPTREPAADDANPCGLLTPALAAEVLQQTPPAPDMDSPTMCSYTVDGANGLGDTLSLAVEKWQDGLTVQGELDGIGIQGPNGAENPQSLADSTLGADAVDVWDDDSVAVVWKAGDVHKLVVTGAKRVPDTKALLIDVAEKITAGKRS